MAKIGSAGKFASAIIVAASALAFGSALAGPAAASAAIGRAAQKTQTMALTNVSCTSVRHCIAIGRVGTAAFPSSLARAWNGSHWRAIAAPGVAGPLGLGCLGTSFCLVGGNDPSKGQTDTSVWNGKTWKVSPDTPAPSFNQISCVNKKFCVTVGFGGAILAWNGTAWHFFKNIPEPVKVNDFQLSSVSCTSAKFCLAVGFFTTLDSDNTQTVAETWDGSAWHLVSSPSNDIESTLNAVSCISPIQCTAVGAMITSAKKPNTDTEANISARWDGETFHVTRLPGKVGVGFGADLGQLGLAAISCSTARNCMAVGNFGARPADSFGGIAVAWNGAKWQLTKLRGSVSTLNDVSCPAAKDCIAVGRTGSHTMAQRWNGKTWTLLSTP